MGVDLISAQFFFLLRYENCISQQKIFVVVVVVMTYLSTSNWRPVSDPISDDYHSFNDSHTLWTRATKKVF